MEPVIFVVATYLRLRPQDTGVGFRIPPQPLATGSGRERYSSRFMDRTPESAVHSQQEFIFSGSRSPRATGHRSPEDDGESKNVDRLDV